MLSSLCEMHIAKGPGAEQSSASIRREEHFNIKCARVSIREVMKQEISSSFHFWGNIGENLSFWQPTSITSLPIPNTKVRRPLLLGSRSTRILTKVIKDYFLHHIPILRFRPRHCLSIPISLISLVAPMQRIRD
jgi:hypothetical protein